MKQQILLFLVLIFFLGLFLIPPGKKFPCNCPVNCDCDSCFRCQVRKIVYETFESFASYSPPMQQHAIQHPQQDITEPHLHPMMQESQTNLPQDYQPTRHIQYPHQTQQPFPESHPQEQQQSQHPQQEHFEVPHMKYEPMSLTMSTSELPMTPL